MPKLSMCDFLLTPKENSTYQISKSTKDQTGLETSFVKCLLGAQTLRYSGLIFIEHLKGLSKL